MFYFHEDHLRITKPKTADGRTPLYDDQTGKQVVKVIYAPWNSVTMKHFEDENTRLPNGLKMKIEKIKGYQPAPIEAPVQVVDNSQQEQMEKRLNDLAEQNKLLQEQLFQILAKKEDPKVEVKEPYKPEEPAPEKTTTPDKAKIKTDEKAKS